ncbi:MAG: TraR/DksA C4-type zinc finger protein [Solibacillus sp.]|uniref:TraR/DksA C4-type zinc finger protein n=1 Tax=unclassified Solibacillus TaxID=2637870 RepID=UPI0030F8E6B9
MNEKQVLQLRQTLEQELHELQKHFRDEPNADNSELSSVDNHPADAATDLTTVVTEIALDELKEEEIEKIQAALRAMDEGTYGKCVVCGKDIPFERLEAVPTALTCIEHVDEVE